VIGGVVLGGVAIPAVSADDVDGERGESLGADDEASEDGSGTEGALGGYADAGG
jgi:hypothetical protein